MQRLFDPKFWKSATTRLVPCVLFCLVGILLATTNVAHDSGISHKFLRSAGILIYLIFASSFLHILTGTASRRATHYMGASRASTLRFTLRIIGYILILLGLLSLLHIPLAKLLFGGAVVGVILGVAAQQALANFFASIVIIIDRPFMVGQHVAIISGALGGTYTGTITDISFSHTRLQLEDGNKVSLPNATLLSGAAITKLPKVTPQNTREQAALSK
ncbi:MAG TPA: mechanosensitive ion channel family protein [Verrucomicrobiae bacterium]|nr:mechanosensitive ion channel family protein [Verrucomicrobiae bacterium]